MKALSLFRFVAQAVAGAFNTGLSWTIDSLGTGTRDSQIQVNTDGTVSMSLGTSSSLSNYYTPSTAGIGTGVWVRFVSVSGTGTLTGTATIGTRFQLTSSYTLGLRRTTVGTNQRVITVEFWNAASGGSVIASQTLTLNVERTA